MPLDIPYPKPVNPNPMINLDNLMNRAVGVGNGESRKWCSNAIGWGDIPLWGCNAIYRDMWVDNLVSVDYAMQQEIYTSDILEGQFDNSLEDHMKFHFANWSPIPAEISDMMFMGYNIPEEFVHKTERAGNHTEQCVISGKEPSMIQSCIELAMKEHPDLDPKDLKTKMEKDVGVWITYLREEDNIKSIDFPVGWSAGTTAMHLACQEGPEEIYMIGFDLSSYDEPLNNIYKGTDNYLPSDAKGFNTINWLNQMQTVFTEFKEITFYWVDPVHRKGEISDVKYNNVRYLTKTEFCDKFNIQ